MSYDEFIITHSSTDSMVSYPENSTANYKVKLGKQFELEGDWEVALMNMQYPFNWPNYQEDYIAIFAKLSAGAEALSKAFHNSCALNKLKFLNDSKSATLYQYLEDYLDHIKDELTDYKIIKIPTSYYPHVGVLAKYFTNAFNRRPPSQKRGRRTWRIDSYYDAYTGAVSFVETNIIWFQFASGGPRIHHAIGNIPKNWNDKLFLSSPTLNPELKIKINTLDTMFIHCDIVKYQVVGETQLPLIAIMPIQGFPNEQCFWSFNPPFYLPVSQKSFSTLQIKLCTPSGESFPFGEDGTVVMQMHFRRKRSPW